MSVVSCVRMLCRLLTFLIVAFICFRGVILPACRVERNINAAVFVRLNCETAGVFGVLSINIGAH